MLTKSSGQICLFGSKKIGNNWAWFTWILHVWCFLLNTPQSTVSSIIANWKHLGTTVSQPCKATEQNRQVLRCMGRRSHQHSVGVTFRWPSTYVHIMYAQDIRWCLIKRACQSIQYKTLRTKGSLWNSRDEKVPWILSHNVSVSRPYFCVLFESSVHLVFQVKRPTRTTENT